MGVAGALCMLTPPNSRPSPTEATLGGRSMSAVRAGRSVCLGFGYASQVPIGEYPQFAGEVWSGAGSNRRPSAFQVNRAKRCADLRKR
jgi:hypothetical protein